MNRRDTRYVITVLNADGYPAAAWQAPNRSSAVEQARAERARGNRVTVHNWVTGKIVFGRNDAADIRINGRMI